MVFEKEDDERAVMTALADKSVEDWEDECWRHGAMIALLQRAVRRVFCHDDAQDIFDNDADDHDECTLRNRLHCALGVMWRRCLASSSDDAEQRRAMSKVRSSLNGYFKAMNFDERMRAWMGKAMQHARELSQAYPFRNWRARLGC